jgi:hypothetical protein
MFQVHQLSEKLNLSDNRFKNLSQLQIVSIQDILQSPPSPLNRLATLVPYKDFVDNLSHYGVPIHAAEYPYRSLCDVINTIYHMWNLTDIDHSRLLRAICR